MSGARPSAFSALSQENPETEAGGLAADKAWALTVPCPNPIGSDGGALFDNCFIAAKRATLVTDKTAKSPFRQLCQFLGWPLFSKQSFEPRQISAHRSALGLIA